MQTIRRAASDEIRVIQRLREEVWNKAGTDASLMASLVADGHDGHAEHWVVEEGGMIVAAGRVCAHDRIEDCPIASALSLVGQQLVPPIGMVLREVVLPSSRRRGLAAMLEQRLVESARAQACRTAVSVIGTSRLRNCIERGWLEVGPADLSAWSALAGQRRHVIARFFAE
jgi:GNAT superfamily N-acetyltransferase